MEKYYQAVDKRCSVRTYRSNLSTKDLMSLRDYADTLQSNGIRIVVGRSSKIFSAKLLQKRITGTECFAAIISENGKDVYAGYIGELFMLECTSRGIGTCWLGASFKMGAAKEVIELEPGEQIVCVTPLGVPGEPFTRRKRRSVSDLTGLSVSEFLELPKWQQCAVECARLAPSAMNAQPWDIYIYDNSIGIVNISRNYGFGVLDCGIAMLHTELGAAHYGVVGEWNLDKDDEAVFEVRSVNEQIANSDMPSFDSIDSDYNYNETELEQISYDAADYDADNYDDTDYDTDNQGNDPNLNDFNDFNDFSEPEIAYIDADPEDSLD